MKEAPTRDQITVRNIANSAGVAIGDGARSIVNFFRSEGEWLDRKNKLVLLRRVEDAWVKGVLEKSVHEAALIELGMRERADAIEHPLEMVLEALDLEKNRTLPQGTRIVDVFDEMAHSLLILGAPGSGKTITLLELARDTITRAQSDPSEPIPVVFNLSSWARQQRLAEWLVRELNTQYQISRNTGRKWLENNSLLLLLDGLDEVAEGDRDKCARALNDFRREHGLTDVVVCSRTEEYRAIKKRLTLEGAILLQSLMPKQIDEYLAAVGPKLASLRAALDNDSSLQALASTPLMLSIMSLAYEGLQPDAIASSGEDSVEGRRRALFDTYIERMFRRRAKADQAYTEQQSAGWLSWLARQLRQHDQTVFLIEQLQPSWLSTQRQRLTYFLVSRLAGGLFIAAYLVPLYILFEGAYVPHVILVSGALLVPFIALGGYEAVQSRRGLDRLPDTRLSKASKFPSSLVVFLLVGVVLSVALALHAPFWLRIGGSGALLVASIALGVYETVQSRRGLDGLSDTPLSKASKFPSSLVVFPLVGVVLAAGLSFAPFWLRIGGSGALLVASIALGAYETIQSRRGLHGLSDTPLSKASKFPSSLVVFLLVGVVLAAGLFFAPLELIIVGLPFGLIFGLMRSKRPLLGDVKPVESLSWSWRGFLRPVLIVGVLLGTLSFGAASILYDRDPGMILWDLEGNRVASSKGHSFYLDLRGTFPPEFSPDGTRLVSDGGDGARLWDAKDGRPIAALDAHEAGVRSASFSADGTKVLTVGWDGTARLWYALSGSLLTTIPPHAGGVVSASLSPDASSIVIGSKDGAVRLWDIEDGSVIANLRAPHTDPVWTAEFDRTGTRILTYARDDTVALWDGADGSPIAFLDGVESLLFSPDGRRIVTIVTRSTDSDPVNDHPVNVPRDRFSIWDAEDGSLIAVFPGNNYGYSFSLDGSWIAMPYDANGVRKLSGEETVGIQDGSLGATGVQIWSLEDGSLGATIDVDGGVSEAFFIPGGDRLMTIDRSDTVVRVWNIHNAEEIVAMDGRPHNPARYSRIPCIGCVSVSADGRHAIIPSSPGGGVQLWNLEDGLFMFTLDHQWDPAFGLFSPDGTGIITISPAIDLRPLSPLLLIPALALGLFGGVRKSVRESKTLPNLGTWLSLRNAVITGLLAAIMTGLIVFALAVLLRIIYLRDQNPLELLDLPMVGLLGIPPLPWILLAFSPLPGILAFLWFGGLDAMKHFLLRAILAFKGCIPRDYVRFLNFATERILLQKVGGGYIFIHRLLLEHFVTRESYE